MRIPPDSERTIQDNDDYFIFSRYDGSNHNLFYFNDGKELRFLNQNKDIYFDVELDDNRWHHVAYTFKDADALAEIQETGALHYNAPNKTFSFNGNNDVTGSNEYGVNVNSGSSGFASIESMASAFQNHQNYDGIIILFRFSAFFFF